MRLMRAFTFIGYATQTSLCFPLTLTRVGKDSARFCNAIFCLLNITMCTSSVVGDSYHLFVQHAFVTLRVYQYKAITQCYPNPNPNIKNDTKYGLQSRNPDTRTEKSFKGRLFAGYALGLGFLG